jgi:hypothetical protein
VEWVAWVAWEEWVAWECNPLQVKNLKAISIDGLFFIKNIMSKRYSGKSFKDSSVKKKPKLSLKEKRKIKREKRKNLN